MKSKNLLQRGKWLLVTLLLATSLIGCGKKGDEVAEGTEGVSANETSIIIAATSDLHGRIYPYDYAVDEEDNDAGFAKTYTIVKELRKQDPNMILIDVGDTVQDNSAELFNGDPVHPMVEAMNEMSYDTWIIGNHEFNFEQSFIKKNIKAFDGDVVTANIKNEADESYFLEPYKIYNRNGVRVAVVGLTAPHVPLWEASTPEHFEGLLFTDALETAMEVVDSIEGQYDILIGAFHIGREDEHGGSGAIEIAQLIPEFDIIFHGHEHAFHVTEVNGATVIEPGAYGKAVAVSEIKLVKDGENWKIEELDVKNMETKDVEPDSELLAKFKDVHQTSLANANEVVGEVTGDFVNGVDYITGEDKVTTMPRAQLEDTAVIDLINEVQMFYTDADISSAALFNFGSNLKEGPFKRKDVAFIYKYPNTLMGVEISGENLLKYMEWSASYYNTWKEGDVTISFNPDVRGYNYDMFSGMTYEIDLSQEAGSRIKNLKINGKNLDKNKKYKIALNNYRYGTLIKNGWATNEDKYFDSYEKYQDAGRMRDLIIKYVIEEKNGVLEPTVDNNWKIVGANLDIPEKETIFEKIKTGEIAIPKSEDGRTLNIRSINKSDL